MKNRFSDYPIIHISWFHCKFFDNFFVLYILNNEKKKSIVFETIEASFELLKVYKI